ncbi:pectinesterase inhibitor 9-like [Miscanthus floridulus]|uniref:pectinesterase inhibitor 9-like n=1 Tax=Miscanthus floridulus TaxID=154761 RepID=UPI003457D0DC
MARLSLLLLAAATAAFLAVAAASPVANDFIRRSCRAMQYPLVCEQSLASYGGSLPPRSPRDLARAALSVSVDRARAASAYVGRLCGGSGAGAKGAKGSGSRPAAAAGPARDCLENLADSVGHLRDTAQEIEANLGGGATSTDGADATSPARSFQVQARLAVVGRYSTVLPHTSAVVDEGSFSTFYLARLAGALATVKVHRGSERLYHALLRVRQGANPTSSASSHSATKAVLEFAPNGNLHGYTRGCTAT